MGIPLSETLLVAIIGGAISVITVSLTRRGNRENTILDLMMRRLDSAERRLDQMEGALEREKERANRLRQLTLDLTLWASAAWNTLRRSYPSYPPPPGLGGQDDKPPRS